MPYYPNVQTTFVNQDELSLFNQWKMQQQMGFNQYSQQQQQNQSTGSRPSSDHQSDHQSFNLIDETEDENEEELIPTPTSKKSNRGARLKAKAKKTKDTESQVEIKKRSRNVWTQNREFAFGGNSFIFKFFSEAYPKNLVVSTKRYILSIKILERVQYRSQETRFIDVNQNMLTEKWNTNECNIQKFNQLVAETLALSGENDEDWITRVEILYKTHVGTEFKHKSAWLFLKGKHKWTNTPNRQTQESIVFVLPTKSMSILEMMLPRPPGLQRIAKSQRSGSNSTASRPRTNSVDVSSIHERTIQS
ncbi:hypothetical protein Tco_1099936 [Tanacetum coccineum]